MRRTSANDKPFYESKNDARPVQSHRIEVASHRCEERLGPRRWQRPTVYSADCGSRLILLPRSVAREGLCSTISAIKSAITRATASLPPLDELILAREAFWKRNLLTRGEHGLKRN